MNLGRVAIVPQGDYNLNKQYKKLDLVQLDGSSFIALTFIDIGQTPLITPDKWMLSGQRGEQGIKGNIGLSAYESYVLTTSDSPVLTEQEWSSYKRLNIAGNATQTNAPTVYTPEAYPNGLFETYVVRKPLTMPNSWGSVVTQAELDVNYVFFDVKNGVISKELSAKDSQLFASPLYRQNGYINLTTSTEYRKISQVFIKEAVLKVKPGNENNEYSIVSIGLHNGNLSLQMFKNGSWYTDVVLEPYPIDLGIKKYSIDKIDFSLDLFIDLSAHTFTNLITDFNLKLVNANIQYIKSTVKDTLDMGDRIRGYYFDEINLSNDLFRKTFVKFKAVFKKDVDEDYVITSFGKYTDGRVLLQIKTVDNSYYGDFYFATSPPTSSNSVIEYKGEDNRIIIECTVNWSHIGVNNFNTSFAVKPIKYDLTTIPYDYSTSFFNYQNLNNGTSYLSLFEKIGVIGDSYASGEIEGVDPIDQSTKYLDLYYNSWGQQLARMNGNKAINFSSGGLTTHSWLTSPQYNKLILSENKCDCYFIDLGRNDSIYTPSMGTISDVNVNNPSLNPDTYYGNYGKIISKIKEVSPKAKIFCVTINNGFYTGDFRGLATAVRQIANLFENCFVVDLEKYIPINDSAFISQYYNGHPNSLGYRWYALIINTYVDWLIKRNLDSFRDISLIDTEYIIKN